MPYKVDKEAVLDQVKPGDQITATVNEDMILSNVKVVSGDSKKKK